MTKKEIYNRLNKMTANFRALSAEKQRLYLDGTMAKVVEEAKTKGADLAELFIELKDLFEQLHTQNRGEKNETTN